ncbi:MAG: hypothetical protein N6V49_04720 [Serratia symbiotica]|nr:hypothetical protein [Serratia symbiotica]
MITLVSGSAITDKVGRDMPRRNGRCRWRTSPLSRVIIKSGDRLDGRKKGA